jgi:hypothetical protein
MHRRGLKSEIRRVGKVKPKHGSECYWTGTDHYRLMWTACPGQQDSTCSLECFFSSFLGFDVSVPSSSHPVIFSYKLWLLHAFGVVFLGRLEMSFRCLRHTANKQFSIHPNMYSVRSGVYVVGVMSITTNQCISLINLDSSLASFYTKPTLSLMVICPHYLTFLWKDMSWPFLDSLYAQLIRRTMFVFPKTSAFC